MKSTIMGHLSSFFVLPNTCACFLSVGYAKLRSRFKMDLVFEFYHPSLSLHHVNEFIEYPIFLLDHKERFGVFKQQDAIID